MIKAGIILLGWLSAFGPLFDAGLWVKHESPVEDVLHNGFFVGQEGWAISHNTGRILHTVVGGRWVVQAQVGEGYLESIFFFDKSRGWICGDQGRVYRTINGGGTWLSSGSFDKTAAFYAVHFFDDKRGFVAGLDSRKRTGLFFETFDGGMTWNDRSKEVNAPRGSTDAVFFLGKTTGFIGGVQCVLRTDDGGKTWKTYDTGAEGAIRGLFFRNQLSGWAVGHRGLLLRTSDGGRTWAKKPPFTDSLLRSIAFVDENRGFIAGGRSDKHGSLWITEDGGETWRDAQAGYPDLHRLILTPARLWAMGADGIILSYSR